MRRLCPKCLSPCYVRMRHVFCSSTRCINSTHSLGRYMPRVASEYGWRGSKMVYRTGPKLRPR